MSSAMTSQTAPQPHIALFPSAGMGHLNPFLRLASLLLSHNCTVTLITAKPTVSVAESSHISFFLSTHPEIKHLEFQVLPLQQTSNATIADPFFVQFEATRNSVHLIRPLLSSLSPPLSAIFSDYAVISGVVQVAAELRVPTYVVSTTSAKFLSFMAFSPNVVSDPAKFSSDSKEVQIIPGLDPLPISSIPPPILDPNNAFRKNIVTNARALPQVEGILMNTFHWFESETVSAFNNYRTVSNLPPILPIGPLLAPYELEDDRCEYLSWLDNQPVESVVYVSFGSRTAMSKDQMRELSNGLEKSEYRFLWVLKGKKVDKEDDEDLEDLLGSSFIQKTKNKGRVVKGWIKQEEVLAHPAIGGFISHCGWNSVTEAAQRGIPMLAWPLNGDQRVNADIVLKAGLGIWESSWGWIDQHLVNQDEIQRKIGEVMGDEKLRSSAKKVGEEARKSCEIGGTSTKTLMGVIESLKPKQT